MKTASLALAAVLVVGGLSAPAFAADDPRFDGDYFVTQLQQRGVNAVNVYEKADNVIRAEVKLADGSTAFQYFYEDTLAPVKPAGEASSTRVLSRVDTGAKAPVSNDSLLVDNFFD